MDTTSVISANFYFYDTASKRIVRLYDGMVFGRLAGNEQFAHDKRMSREHLKIAVRSGEVLVEDLNSSNKTHLNRMALVSGQSFRLNENDVVEFGAQKMIFTTNRSFGDANALDVLRDFESASGESRLFERSDKKLNLVVSAFFCRDGWDWSATTFSIFGIGLFSAAVVSVREPLRGGLVFSPVIILAKIAVGFGTATLLGALWQCLSLKILPLRGLLKSFYWMPAALVAMTWLFLAQKILGYPLQLMGNQVAKDCGISLNTSKSESRSFDRELCLRMVRFHPNAFLALPQSVQIEIDYKLQD